MNDRWSQRNPGFQTPNQEWWRSPEFGDTAAYNETYGWQNHKAVEDMYKQQGWNQTPEQFSQWGMTPQLGQDWSQYGFTQGQGPQNNQAGLPGNWGDMVNQWSQWFQGLRNQQGQGTGGTGGGMDGYGYSPDLPLGGETGQGGQGGQGAQGGTGGFQYPSQWGTASDVFTQFAQGLPTQTPWQWQQGSDIASQMAQSGMPTSYEPMYQQAKGIAERDTTQAIKQAAEQAGLSGTRWSTPLGQTAQRIAGENMANLGLGFAGQEMGALEAARGRQMGGVDQLYGFGQGSTGLTEAAKNRGMSAAGGLTGLGQQYLNAPQDWAAQMYQMGGGMQQQNQSALDRYYQDYMRLSPENNPWVNQGMTYWGTPSQMGYQQYNPSTMSQIGGAASGLGMLGLGIC